MKYAKPPLSIADQIELLRSRGMSIPDQDRATRYLNHISYYRLRAYWLPFEVPGNNPDHCFRRGTSFDQALSLYIFDRKFRLLVLEAIERVEVSFRTQFAYVLALKYGSHAHMDAQFFHDAAKYRALLGDLKQEIERSHETFIEHYQAKYTSPALPPIWAVCEVMSFGQLSKWFKNLKFRNDRKQIAQAYGVDESVLSSFMHHLTHVRNLVAHHCRLWNRSFTVTMTLPRNPTSLVEMCHPAADRRIYNTLVMLGYLLRRISPGTTWPIRMRQLIEETPGVDTAAMGFPGRWRDISIWIIP